MKDWLLTLRKNKDFMLTLVLTTLMLTSCDSGSDDGTVGNWFCAIVFLLALLKGGKN